MAYKLDWVKSPNFTPGSQTKAFYGRPRTIEKGAGHWWNWPRSGARHAGIVSYMAQASRQAAPHAVLSAGWVTEMVKPGDTAWCTGNANPYTYAIEVDPRIMFKWGYDNPSKAERSLGEEIFETLAEYIADKRYQNLDWQPHNFYVKGTQCNPIHWAEVEVRAKNIYKAKYEAPKPAPVTRTSRQVFSPSKKMVVRKDTHLLNIPAGTKATSEIYKAGQTIDNVAELTTWSNGRRYYRTKYSVDTGAQRGFDANTLADPVPPKPEWLQNLKDITPVKLMVLVPQTDIVHLETLASIKKLGQGTWVDFTKKTTVKGVEYLISSYSATNAMPNGIRVKDVGVPAEPPVNEKPEWLKNWQDITDKVMYARADIQVVNLLDGKTVSTIKRGTAVDIGSATTWLDTPYLITKYSTDKKLPHGIALVDLSDKPIDNPDQPVEPAPEQPSLEERVNILEKLVALIRAALAKIGINI